MAIFSNEFGALRLVRYMLPIGCRRELSYPFKREIANSSEVYFSGAQCRN
jgi:hypothetical protein